MKVYKKANQYKIFKQLLPTSFKKISEYKREIFSMDKVGSFISAAETLAATLGTSGSGQIDRGNGKMVNWSFQGKLMGFEWKYIGICVDQTTGETSTAVKQSRPGAIEHSMRDLFQRLAARNAL